MPFSQRTRSLPVTSTHPLSPTDAANGSSPADVRNAASWNAELLSIAGDLTVKHLAGHATRCAARTLTSIVPRVRGTCFGPPPVPPIGASTALIRLSRLALPFACFVVPVLLSQTVAPPPAAPVNPPPAAAAQSKPMASPGSDTHMTKDQAAALFKSVDDILAFVSKDTHLPATRPVKRRLLTRDEVKRELAKKMNDDEGTKRLERSELVLKKFGLLDRDFQLRPFLLNLLTEQVAAYYEPKTRTVNLMDWVSPDEQKPVLAHELTHAVQDDHVHLEKWGDPQPANISKTVADDNRHISLDEASTSREAVTEGQAMVAFVDYEIKDTGRTLATAPELGDRVRSLSTDMSGSPVLARAPLLLQQSLLFPYSAGLGFEQALLIERGVDAAFAGALDRPPSSSHEVMHPEDYIAHRPVPVLTMPDIHPLLDKDWEPYDVGVMGELDVRILAELFGGQSIAGPLAVAWDGGIYYAAQRRAATPEQKVLPGSIGILYFSQWKNRDSARSFLKVYAGELQRKYDSLKRVELPNGDDDHQLYTTAEGDVWLSLEDKAVFVSEGYDRAIAKQLDTLYRDAQGHGPLMTAGVMQAHGELALGLSRMLPDLMPRGAVLTLQQAPGDHLTSGTRSESHQSIR